MTSELIKQLTELDEAGDAMESHKMRGSVPAPHMCQDPPPKLKAAWNEWMDASREHNALERTFRELSVNARPAIKQAIARIRELEAQHREDGVLINNLCKDSVELSRKMAPIKAALEDIKEHCEAAWAYNWNERRRELIENACQALEQSNG